MRNIINRVTYAIYRLFSKQVKQSLDIKVYICFVIDSFIIYINLIFNNLNCLFIISLFKLYLKVLQ